MSDELVLEATRKWLGYTEYDISLLRRGTGDPLTPPALTCYHAQQASEKGLKTALTFVEVDFPQTHDLWELVNLLPGDWPFNLTKRDFDRLTRWTTAARYPGPWPLPKKSDAKWCWEAFARLWRDLREGLIQRGLSPAEIPEFP